MTRNARRYSIIGVPIICDVLPFRQSCILVPLPDLVTQLNGLAQLLAGAHAAGDVTA
jgi:hypothetical protein